MTADLDALISQLEGAATQLRSGDIDAEQAAELIERCAELAASLGSELDRAAREVERDPAAEGQEQLL
jgi:exonuclease VII small subunit